MTKYSDEFKIKAVQMVLKDNTVESVTRILNIPSHSTLDAWLAHYNHGGIIRVLLCLFLGVDLNKIWNFSVGNCSTTTLAKWRGYNTVLECTNETYYLR